MANLPDGSGDAYSNLVQGDGSASLTFVMPGTVPLDVTSVVATVDNAAGGDTTATLVIRDPSGEVVATKRQGAVIGAGATGTATWALRLDDEGGTTALANPIGFYDVEPIGGNPWNAASTLTALNLSFGGSGAGTALLDLTTYGAAAPLPLVAGMYAIEAALFFTPGGGGTFAANKTVRVVLLVANDFAPQNFYSQLGDATFPLDNSFTSSTASVGWTRYFDPKNLNGTVHEAAFFELDVYKPLAASLNIFGQVSVQRLY